MYIHHFKILLVQKWLQKMTICKACVGCTDNHQGVAEDGQEGHREVQRCRDQHDLAGYSFILEVWI